MNKYFTHYPYTLYLVGLKYLIYSSSPDMTKYYIFIDISIKYIKFVHILVKIHIFTKYSKSGIMLVDSLKISGFKPISTTLFLNYNYCFL